MYKILMALSFALILFVGCEAMPTIKHDSGKTDKAVEAVKDAANSVEVEFKEVE